MPRAVAMLVGAILLFLWPNTVLYSLLFAAGCVLSILLSVMLLIRRTTESNLRVRGSTILSDSLHEIRSGASSFLIAFVMVLRLNGPTLLLTQAMPSQAPLIALVDKFLKWANTALTPVSQVLLAWIGKVPAALVHRLRKSILVSGVLVAVSCALAFFALPYLSLLLSAGLLRIDGFTSLCITFIACGLFVSGLLANAGFVARSEGALASWIASTVTLFMLVTLYFVADIWTVPGSFAFVAVCEWLYVCIQILLLSGRRFHSA